jgi:cytochrome P450
MNIWTLNSFIYPPSSYLVYDAISDLVLGEPVGFVGQGTDIGGFIQALEDVQMLSAFQRRMYPFWRWLMSTWLAPYATTTAEDDTMSRVFDEIYEKRLQAMGMDSEKDAEGASLLRTILETQAQELAPLDAESTKSEVKFHFLAGIDVTAAAFQSILVYILSDGEVYKRVVGEIDGFPREVRVARQTDILNHCPYYVACVQEALRLCPPASNILPRLVSRPGMEIDGRHVPSGMEISCSPWIVNRDPSLYGNDAELFRPERWLGTLEERKLLTKYSETFGYGSRTCLGKDLAMLILYKVPFQVRILCLSFDSLYCSHVVSCACFGD